MAEGGKPVIVGYVERVALRRWGVGSIAAKVDTGAESCALHVERLDHVGTTRVRFEVLFGRGAKARRVSAVARVVRRGLVRVSNGETRERIFVRTALTLAGRTQTVEVGLVDREQMIYRMLIGRSALDGYLVDPTRKYLTKHPVTR